MSSEDREEAGDYSTEEDRYRQDNDIAPKTRKMEGEREKIVIKDIIKIIWKVKENKDQGIKEQMDGRILNKREEQDKGYE